VNCYIQCSCDDIRQRYQCLASGPLPSLVFIYADRKTVSRCSGAVVPQLGKENYILLVPIFVVFCGDKTFVFKLLFLSLVVGCHAIFMRNLCCPSSSAELKEAAVGFSETVVSECHSVASDSRT
jgi:hypothetical protein